MSCQPTKCLNCPARPKACQMKNGLCPSCYAASIKPIPAK